MSKSNEELIKQVKALLEKNAVEQNSAVKMFSEDVITSAYQKMSASVTDMIENEEDPMVLAEILKSFLEVTKMVNEKDLNRQQVLIKLFEQLNKYEQSRYY